jgi:hypothetical protein
MGGSDGKRSSPRPGVSASRYIVFVSRNGRPAPVWIQTGLTDMDYSEVLEGLSLGDSVLVLPSASLVQQQTDARDRMTRMTGGGAVPGMTSQQPTRSGTTGTTGTTGAPAGGTRPPGGR